MKSAPCKGCLRRSLGCHSICPAYYEWRSDHEATKKKERAYKDSQEDIVAHNVKVADKIKRSKKRHG